MFVLTVRTRNLIIMNIVFSQFGICNNTDFINCKVRNCVFTVCTYTFLDFLSLPNYKAVKNGTFPRNLVTNFQTFFYKKTIGISIKIMNFPSKLPRFPSKIKTSREWDSQIPHFVHAWSLQRMMKSHCLVHWFTIHPHTYKISAPTRDVYTTLSDTFFVKSALCYKQVCTLFLFITFSTNYTYSF